MPALLRLLTLFMAPLLGAAADAGDNTYGPVEGGGPTVVDIGFMLSNINGIDDESETFDFEGVLSLRWQDPRLAFDPEKTGYDELYYQGDYQFNEVFTGWWPQIVLANEAGRFDKDATMLRVTPDGTVRYTQEVDAIAKSTLQLRRFPFDRQQFYAIFEVLGLDKRRVVLRVDPATSGLWDDHLHRVSVPQWKKPSLDTRVVEYDPVYGDGHTQALSALRVQVDIARDPLYFLRLVVLPVVVFVILSWSVFWMDRSSLGDRMDISFIGILTVIAYQLMFSESLPKISYTTVLMTFMIISFLTMCATVAVNLRVAALDNSGRHLEGDRMDRRCRYLFPLAYALLCTVACGYLYATG